MDFNTVINNLYNCSIGNYETLELEVAQGIHGLNIILKIPQNIIALRISRKYQFRNKELKSKRENISLNGNSILIEQPAFFSYLSNLAEIRAESLIFRYLPTFSNKSITILQSIILNETNRVINRIFVSESKGLEVLSWVGEGIIGIQKKSFSGLKSLKSLTYRITEFTSYRIKCLQACIV